MERFASAYLVYAQEAPPDWTADDAEARLPGGGPLGYISDGNADRPAEEPGLLLTIKGGVYSAHETYGTIGRTPASHPDVRDLVNARKLYEHLTQAMDNVPPWDPQWYLVPVYG